MFKQTYSYRKGIETRKKQKSKEKIEQKQVKAKFPAENVEIR